MINPRETTPTNNITPIIRIGGKAKFTATTGIVQGAVVAATGVSHGPRKTVIYVIVDTLGGFHYATQECVSPITKSPQNRTTTPKPATQTLGRPRTETADRYDADEAQWIRDTIKSCGLTAIIAKNTHRGNTYYYVSARLPHEHASKHMLGRLCDLQSMDEDELRELIAQKFPNVQEASHAE